MHVASSSWCGSSGDRGRRGPADLGLVRPSPRIVTRPSSPSILTRSPALIAVVPPPVPTTVGSPHSRQTIAAWHMAPRTSVNAPANLVNAGAQLGEVVQARGTRSSTGVIELLRLGDGRRLAHHSVYRPSARCWSPPALSAPPMAVRALMISGTPLLCALLRWYHPQHSAGGCWPVMPWPQPEPGVMVRDEAHVTALNTAAMHGASSPAHTDVPPASMTSPWPPPAEPPTDSEGTPSPAPRPPHPGRASDTAHTAHPSRTPNPPAAPSTPTAPRGPGMRRRRRRSDTGWVASL